MLSKALGFSLCQPSAYFSEVDVGQDAVLVLAAAIILSVRFFRYMGWRHVKVEMLVGSNISAHAYQYL